MMFQLASLPHPALSRRPQAVNEAALYTYKAGRSRIYTRIERNTALHSQLSSISLYSISFIRWSGRGQLTHLLNLVYDKKSQEVSEFDRYGITSSGK